MPIIASSLATTAPYPTITGGASATPLILLSPINGISDKSRNAIIGSIVAGATLAFLLVVAWVLGEKWIQKTRKRRSMVEDQSNLTAIPNPRKSIVERAKFRVHMPGRGRCEKKVQFAPQLIEKSTTATAVNTSLETVGSSAHSPSHLAAQVDEPLPSARSSRATHVPSDTEETSLLPSGSSTPTLVNLTPPPTALAPRTLRPAKARMLQQKPTLSTLDSVSVYSTQSVHERPPSWTTAAWNRYSLMSKTSWTSDKGTGGNGRYYQISEDSRNSPAPSFRTAGTDIDEATIGIAY